MKVMLIKIKVISNTAYDLRTMSFELASNRESTSVNI